MDARELRIGNLLDRNGLVVKVGSNTILAIDENPEILGEIYKPIPLTERWLLKFGFEVDDSDSLFERFVHFKTDGFEVKLFPDSNTFEIWLGNDNSGCFSKRFNYVHQLQNFYFALTGEELCLKMSS